MEESDRVAQTAVRNWMQKVHLRATDVDVGGLMSFYNFTELGCVCKMWTISNWHVVVSRGLL